MPQLKGLTFTRQKQVPWCKCNIPFWASKQQFELYEGDHGAFSMSLTNSLWYLSHRMEVIDLDLSVGLHRFFAGFRNASHTPARSDDFRSVPAAAIWPDLRVLSLKYRDEQISLFPYLSNEGDLMVVGCAVERMPKISSLVICRLPVNARMHGTGSNDCSPFAFCLQQGSPGINAYEAISGHDFGHPILAKCREPWTLSISGHHPSDKVVKRWTLSIRLIKREGLELKFNPQLDAVEFVSHVEDVDSAKTEGVDQKDTTDNHLETLEHAAQEETEDFVDFDQCGIEGYDPCD